MDYQVSARKYRPATFGDVIGQPHVVQTLVNAIATKRIPHAFLFSGTRGVGKTTVARIVAKALNCEQGPTGIPCNTCVSCAEITQGTSVDVIEIDGASNTSVDDVREIRENVRFTPFRGTYRVYIIDEVHMLSNSAFNALLKTLEEPPAHVVFIFATTEIHKIPATILSRCQHYNFRRIAKAEIVERLRHVADQAGHTIEDRSLLALARASEGSMRDALSLLDQVAAFGGKTIRHTDLETLLGTVPQEHVRGLIEAVMDQESVKALAVINEVLDQGHDLRSYCADLVEYVRNVLVASVIPAAQDLRGLIEASEEDRRQFATDAKRFTPEQWQDLFRIFTQAEDGLRQSSHPRFVMETAAIRATRLFGQGQERSIQLHPNRQQGQRESQPNREPLAARTAASLSVSEPRPGSQTPVTNSKKEETPPTRMRSTGASPAPRSETPIAPAKEAAKPVARVEGQADASAKPAAPAPPLVLNWEEFQEAVSGQYPNIAPFLEMGRLVNIEGNQVTIGFSKQASIARTRMEKEDTLRALSALCERLGGRPAQVRIVELTETEAVVPTMRQVRAAREEEQRTVLFQQAKSHPVVKQALELFGGEVVAVRPQAPKKEVRDP